MRLFRRHRGPDPLACREFVELVTDYLEGALPPEEVARIEHHLAGCDGCTEYLEQMRATIRTLAVTTQEPQLDPDSRERLLTMFRELRGSESG